MSFPYEVKAELAQNRLSKKIEYRAQGYGLLVCAKSFSPEKIRLQTENEYTLQVCLDFFSGLDIQPQITRNEKDSELVKLAIENPSQCRKVLDYLGCDPQHPRKVNADLVSTPRLLSLFCNGAFLSCGSVTDPVKEYHMEFTLPSQDLVTPITELLSFLVPFKHTVRKGTHLLYLKESEQIEDMLTFMGAPRASVHMMEVKIYKELRNKANRVTNCETANIDKTVNAATAQVEQIQWLLERGGWAGLPEELRELARLRLDHPEMSLRELGEALSKPLSRSGVNHRFKRLAQLAVEAGMPQKQ